MFGRLKRLISGNALVIVYLAAIVLANLSAAKFGPAATIVNALVFIGLDITSRDSLHERWHHEDLWVKMFALIATGSALSGFLDYAVAGTSRIALASMASFFIAGAVDAVAYALLGRFSKLMKINGSNVFSAAVDSVVFPTIAFGSFMPMIALGQFAAKLVGGFAWSLILTRGRK